MSFVLNQDETGQYWMETALKGPVLLTQPLLNKGMSFSLEEREMFELLGHLPPHFATLEEQRQRSYELFCSIKEPLQQYIYLRSLQDSNEVLFYSLLMHHVTEMLPVVYTPVVGLGCQMYSQIYRRPRGLFIAYPDRDRMDAMFSTLPLQDIRVIVVSDGERILGLGDQGAGGMGISIGKLSLYSVCAGIHPAHTLPILLDTGTNQVSLLEDPLYIGWKHERIRGADYDAFIEQFVLTVKKYFPRVLLQWEDFAQTNAYPILTRYRDQLLTFNDDIQGTAAVATATLLSAIQMTGVPLQEHRIVILGAGSAGCGICSLMFQMMQQEGLTEEEARSRFYLVDRSGLLIETSLNLQSFQKSFARLSTDIEGWICTTSDTISLLDVVKNVHPTVLIGVSGQPGMFTETIVREMASHVARPIIFPLSNPTDKSEATPEDLVAWTHNTVIMGTGSPFSPVLRGGHTVRVDQTNNAYIFPGLGLGLVAVEATRVSDAMFIAAAKALAEISMSSSPNLLPPLEQIRDVSYHIAIAVAKEAVETGLASFKSVEEIKAAVTRQVWVPHYLPLKRCDA